MKDVWGKIIEEIMPTAESSKKTYLNTEAPNENSFKNLELS